MLVDGAGDALVTVGAYIDLNPIRAKLVQDPKDYRWSGYGESMAGRTRSRRGLQFLVTALQNGREVSVGKSLEIYRQFLFLEGDARRESVRQDGSLARGSLSAEEVEEVLNAKGKLPVTAYLRCRVRYFCDGAVVGGREFVEGIFNAYRKQFGKKRRTGARPMRGLEARSLFTLRDLRVAVFGGSSGCG